MIFKQVLGNEHGGAFEVMMTTLNMLLLAFFIVLNSIAVIDENRKREALGSLLGTLGILDKGLNPGPETGRESLPRSVSMSKLEWNLLELLTQIEEFAVEARVAKEVSIQQENKGVRISLTNEIAFDRGSDVLMPVAKELLFRVATLMNQMDGDIEIVGHTSEGSYTQGRFPNDYTLSHARAGAAARFMLEDGGVRPARMSVSGYGNERPIVGEYTVDQSRLNDRLEVILDKSGYM